MCFLFFSHPLFCPGEDFSAEAVPEIGGFILRSSRRADEQEGGVRNEKCEKKKQQQQVDTQVERPRYKYPSGCVVLMGLVKISCVLREIDLDSPSMFTRLSS